MQLASTPELFDAKAQDGRYADWFACVTQTTEKLESVRTDAIWMEHAVTGAERTTLLLYGDLAHSPAFARAGDAATIFDGYLANAPALARRLKIESVDGPIPDAAEIILAAYRRWGAECIPYLRGAFTLLIFDKIAGRTIVARDQIGNNPLFFSRQDGYTVISSKISAILASGLTSRALNRPAFVDQLALRRLPADETYYTQINRTPPAHQLVLTQNSAELIRYWQPNRDIEPDDSMTEADLAEFSPLFDQAIERAMTLGKSAIFLSGGLDSVSIAAMAKDWNARHAADAPLALMLGFPDPECDESERQLSVAAQLELPPTFVPLLEAVAPLGIIGAALAMNGGLDVPLQNNWRPAYAHLSALARAQGCEMILTGNGGDDWLTINPRYMADLIGQMRIGEALAFLSVMQKSYALAPLPQMRYLLWQSGVDPLLRTSIRRTARRIAPDYYATLFERRYAQRHFAVEQLGTDQALQEAYRARIQTAACASAAIAAPTGRYGYYRSNSVAETYIQTTYSMELEEDYLVGQKLGVRYVHPYWDVDLIEYLMRVPPQLLAKGGREKGVIRSFVARRFPDLGFASQKKSLAYNFYMNTLRKESADCWTSMQGIQALIELGIVDESQISHRFGEWRHSDNPRDLYRVWHLLNLESWARVHM